MKKLKIFVISVFVHILIYSMYFSIDYNIYAAGTADLSKSEYSTTFNPFSAYAYSSVGCTWYAWGRAYEVLGIKLPVLGNAVTWYDTLSKAGYPVGSEPRANSIAVWRDAGAGHVAFVEAVDGNNVYFTEGGWRGLNGGYGGCQYCHYATRPLSKMAVGANTWNSAEYPQYVVGYVYLNETASLVKPFLCAVDTPAANAVYINDNVIVSGWSIYGGGVSKVTCTVNNQTFTCQQTARKDISENPNLQGYPVGNEGFYCEIPTSALVNGTNTILVTSYCGGQNLGSKSVNIIYKYTPLICNIDTPSANSVYSDKNVTVSGWSVYGKGVSKVTCTVNNQTFTCQRTARKDIADNASLKDYPTDNAGFLYEIPQSALKNGTNTILITSYYGNQNLGSKSVNILYNKTTITEPTGITLNMSALTLTKKGQTNTLTAVISPSNATNKVVTWKSSNTSVVTVNSNGIVTAVANGTATITAVTVSGNKTASCKVTVNIPTVPQEPVTKEPLTITGSADKTSISKGDKVTISGKALGGGGKYTYSYLIHNTDTNAWYRLTPNFIANNTFTWTAGSAGNREFFVEVKDSTGKVVRSNAVNVSTKASSPLEISGKANIASVIVGNKVVISGTVSGGNGPYTYSYLVHNKDTNAWSRLTSSFVTANTYIWTAGSAGNREFFVEVKDSTGKVVRSNAINVKAEKKSAPLTINAGATSSKVSVGGKVVILGTGNGGKGDYTYSYLIHNKDTNAWSRLTPSFIKSNTYTWTAGSAGNREFFVEVKDSTGKIVRSNAVYIAVK